MRELTQVEYSHLWGTLPRDAKRFASFLVDYNLAVPTARRVDYYAGRRGAVDFCIVYRESLPIHLVDKLNAYETARGLPFVEAWLLDETVYN